MGKERVLHRFGRMPDRNQKEERGLDSHFCDDSSTLLKEYFEGLRLTPSRNEASIGPETLLSCAEAMKAGRMESCRALGGPHLSSGPAWDILLDLFVSEQKGRRVSVTDACHAASAPHTTSLRWIAALCSMGFVRRFPDNRDRRRVFLELSEAGRSRMVQAISSYRCCA